MSGIYTPLKIFHFQEKVDSLKHPVEIQAPLHIRIKPTNVCNHRCRYCAYRTDNLQLGQDMVIKDSIPEQKMLEIVDDLIEMKVKAVTFSGGGDPFCYAHLLKTVQKLAQSPVAFAALTNGSRLENEVASVFAHHATWIRISIDGFDNQSYSTYRGVPDGEFSKVMGNLEKFKSLGGACTLGVSIITDPNNAAHLFDLIGQLKSVGVDSVKISPCIVSNIGEENNVYHAPVFELVKQQVQKAKEELASSDFEIYDSYHTQLSSFAKTYTWCPYLQILPVIGADQNIYPCQDKAYNLEQGLIGSIKDVRFKYFWYSDKNKFFKINPSVHCNHHCVADGKNKLILDYLEADNEHLGFV